MWAGGISAWSCFQEKHPKSTRFFFEQAYSIGSHKITAPGPANAIPWIVLLIPEYTCKMTQNCAFRIEVFWQVEMAGRVEAEQKDVSLCFTTYTIMLKQVLHFSDNTLARQEHTPSLLFRKHAVQAILSEEMQIFSSRD